MMNPLFQYTRIIGGIEYEVWGGIAEKDGDLLFAERQPEKRVGAPTKPPILRQPPELPRPHVIDRYLDVQVGRTVRELVALTGLSKSTVANHLWWLRRRGLVRVVGTVKGVRKPHRVYAKAA